jgi:hypothetical protein
MSRSERYRLHSSATAIDDWLICDNRLNTSEYRMACHILRHQKNGDPPPTREQLAEDMQADVRSVDRWIERLRSLDIIHVVRAGRRTTYCIATPKSPRKTDKKISDGTEVHATNRVTMPKSPRKTDKKISDSARTDKKISDK